MKLPARIFLGLLSGVVAGALARALPGADSEALVGVAQTLGNVFIRLITMVVVPLVVASLFVGIASLGDVRRLGRIGGRTLAYFLGTTLAAVVVGLVTALSSGAGRDATGGALVTAAPDANLAASPPGLVQLLVNMVPQNPFAAAAQADLIPLIISVSLFAAACTVLPEERRRPVVAFFGGVNDLSMVVIRWLMQLAPYAVFLLIAAAVAEFGTTVLRLLLWYAAIVVAALAIHVAAVLLPILRLGARWQVLPFFQSVSDAVLLAFSTSSSNVALPVSMAAAETRLGVPESVASFLLPAGTTVNKNGAAVYKAVTAVFIAHVYGVGLGPAQLIAIVLAATAASFAGAGVPGSSLVTTLIVLRAIGLGPRAAAGIALVAGIDRPLDMCRTAVNTISNLIGAAVVGRAEVAVSERTAA